MSPFRFLRALLLEMQFSSQGTCVGDGQPTTTTNNNTAATTENSDEDSDQYSQEEESSSGLESTRSSVEDLDNVLGLESADVFPFLSSQVPLLEDVWPVFER